MGVSCSGISNILRNQVEYMRLSMLIIRDSFLQYTLQEEKRRELTDLLQDPLHQDEKWALSLPARIQFHRNLGNIYALLREKEKSIPHYTAIVDLMDDHPVFLEGQMKSYLMGMNNLMVLLKESRRFQEHNMLFERAKHFMDTLPKKRMNNSIAEVYMMIHTNYISYLLDGLQIGRGIELSQEFSPVVKKHFTEGAFIIFHMNLFLLYFYNGEFKKANRQLNEISVSSAEVMMRDIVDQGRIFSILTHYEMGNWSLLPGLCRSSERYFTKHRNLTRTENVLLRFFRKIRPGIRSFPSVSDFQSLLGELTHVLQKENQFTEFDLLSWCESKVRGMDFLDIVREKKGLSGDRGRAER